MRQQLLIYSIGVFLGDILGNNGERNRLHLLGINRFRELRELTWEQLNKLSNVIHIDENDRVGTLSAFTPMTVLVGRAQKAGIAIF